MIILMFLVIYFARIPECSCDWKYFELILIQSTDVCEQACNKPVLSKFSEPRNTIYITLVMYGRFKLAIVDNYFHHTEFLGEHLTIFRKTLMFRLTITAASGPKIRKYGAV